MDATSGSHQHRGCLFLEVWIARPAFVGALAVLPLLALCVGVAVLQPAKGRLMHLLSI